jgi:hypothetical protein
MALEPIQRPFFLDPIAPPHVRLIERPAVRSREVIRAVAIPLNGEAALVD